MDAIQRIKKENHTTTSIDAGKAFNKIQHSFLTKTLSKHRIKNKETSPASKRTSIKKSTASNYLMGKN